MNNEFNQLEGILELIKKFVPEGTEKSIEAEGVKVSLVNKDGQFKIKIDNLEERCKEDSKELKNCIATFKEKVDSLDDETFDELIKEFEQQGFKLVKKRDFLFGTISAQIMQILVTVMLC